MWTDDHESADADHRVEAGADRRVHAARCSCRCIRTSGRAKVIVGVYDTHDERAAEAGQHGPRRSVVPGGGLRAAAADRERLPDLQGRLAPGGGRAGQSRRSSGSGRRKEATVAFRNPKRDATSSCRWTTRAAAAGAASEVELRLGDQSLGTVPVVGRRRAGPEVSADGGAARVRRHGRGQARREPHVRAGARGRQRRAATRASLACGCFTRSCSRARNAGIRRPRPYRRWT